MIGNIAYCALSTMGTCLSIQQIKKGNNNWNHPLAVVLPGVVLGLGSYGISVLVSVALSPYIVAITTLGQIALGLWVLSTAGSMEEEEYAESDFASINDSSLYGDNINDVDSDSIDWDSIPNMSPFDKRCVVTSSFPNGRLNFDDELFCSIFSPEDHPPEDVVRAVFYEKEKKILLSLYDGHNGETAADFVSKSLPEIIIKKGGDFAGAYDEIDREWWETTQLSADTQEALKFIEEQRKIHSISLDAPLVDWNLSEVKDFQTAVKERLGWKSTSTLAVLQWMHSLTANRDDSGCTAATVLIEESPEGLQARAANVGDTAILIIKRNGDIHKLYTEHSLKNSDERERIKALNIAVKNRDKRVGTDENTRSFGGYPNSIGYQNSEALASATGRPQIAEPDIHPEPVSLDPGDRLVLATDGVYNGIMSIKNGYNALCKQEATLDIDEAFQDLPWRINDNGEDFSANLKNEFLVVHERVSQLMGTLNAQLKTSNPECNVEELKSHIALLKTAKNDLRKFDDSTIVVYTVPKSETYAQ